MATTYTVSVYRPSVHSEPDGEQQHIPAFVAELCRRKTMKRNWRTNMWFRILLALLIPVGIAAQNGTGETLRTWGTVSGAYQLSIASDKAQYEAGEPIKVTSFLKNVSGRVVMVRRTTPEKTYTMEVLMPAQSWLPWRSPAALTPYGDKVKNPHMYSVADFDLPPGAEEDDLFEISKIYEMSVPGEYMITFRCRQPTIRISEMDGKEPPTADVTSNTITVTVLPRRQ